MRNIIFAHSLYNAYMSRIKINNFSPLKETDGWIDIKKWLFLPEIKGVVQVWSQVGFHLYMDGKGFDTGWFQGERITTAKFKNKYYGYHRISNYFIKERSEIFYEGDSYRFTYTKQGEFLIPADNPLVMRIRICNSWISYWKYMEISKIPIFINLRLVVKSIKELWNRKSIIKLSKNSYLKHNIMYVNRIWVFGQLSISTKNTPRL